MALEKDSDARGLSLNPGQKLCFMFLTETLNITFAFLHLGAQVLEISADKLQEPNTNC